MAFVDLLKQIGTLEKATEAVQSSGARKPTWAVIAANVKCLVNPVQAPALEKTGVEELETHVIYTEYRNDIVADPSARWRMTVSGVIYEIIQPYDPGGRKHHLELRCRRTEGP